MNQASVFASVVALEKTVEAFKRDLDALNAYVNESKLQIEKLFHRTDLPHEVTELKDKFDKLFNAFGESQISFANAISQMREIDNEFRQKFTSQWHEHQSLSIQVGALQGAFHAMQDQDTRRYAAFVNEISNRMQDFTGELKKKIHSLNEEVTAFPKSIIESNENILKKLECATLDASNAMLKINNADLAMRMLERRVENLSLQTKKFELALENR